MSFTISDPRHLVLHALWLAWTENKDHCVRFDTLANYCSPRFSGDWQSGLHAAEKAGEVARVTTRRGEEWIITRKGRRALRALDLQGGAA